MKKNFLIMILIVTIVIVLGIIIYPNYNADKRNNNDDKSRNDFILKDLLDREIALSDFLGKKVFLNFWATWCPPCKTEMPYINDIYINYEGIEIITINLREDKRVIEKYLQENDYEFRVLLDKDGKVSNKYRVQGIPYSVLIDEEGKVIDTHTGSMTEEQLIKFMRLD